MRNLNNVTLVAMTSVDLEATVKALKYSCKGITFGAVKLVSHVAPNDLPAYITHCHIGKIANIYEWNYAAIYKLGQYIDTEFALLIHADGFVVNPESWRDEFLQYDYIGAPWPLPRDDFSYRDINGEIIRVGNSVSLRSEEVIDLPVQLNLEWKSFHGFYNEDGFITVNYRHVYKEHGMKFADIEVAKYFSHECMIPEVTDVVAQGIKPFMFHRYAGSNSTYPRFK